MKKIALLTLVFVFLLASFAVACDMDDMNGVSGMHTADSSWGMMSMMGIGYNYFIFNVLGFSLLIGLIILVYLLIVKVWKDLNKNGSRK
ncbi:MAG: hypothetical protein AB1571_00420 [Nanoarchaeota archaeon]